MTVLGGQVMSPSIRLDVKCPSCGNEVFEAPSGMKLDDEVICSRCSRQFKVEKLVGSVALKEARQEFSKIIRDFNRRLKKRV
jgi:DNA-directed RNA polymerase subunit RPC12/RpoP